MATKSVTKLPPPAPKGNTRTVKHGTGSARKLGPVREGHVEMLVVRYPDLDRTRLAFLADLFARIDLASEWLVQQGTVVRNKRGEIFPVAKELERWQKRADSVVRELDAAQRKAKPVANLATRMAALADAEGDGG